MSNTQPPAPDLEPTDQRPTKSSKKKWIVGAVVAVVAIIGLSLIFGEDPDQPEASSTASEAKPVKEPQSPTPAPTREDKIADALGIDKVKLAVDDNTSIMWQTGQEADELRTDVVEAVQAAQDLNLPGELVLEASGAVVDEYGKESVKRIGVVIFDETAMNKLQLDNLTEEQVLNAAEVTEIHPDWQ